jgi:hypothetical protein
MIVAIDESGTFSANSNSIHFFVAVHLRQKTLLYNAKKNQFLAWEKSLPKSLKNHTGEIKSSNLSDEHLFSFCREVIRTHYYVGITPYCFLPTNNPVTVVEKHKEVQLRCIREGVKGYNELKKPEMAASYEEFGNWFNKLNYSQYMKIILLGYCIVNSLINTIGHSISGNYDNELVKLKFIIDRDFIKEPRPNAFWRELLRNQLYSISLNTPIPLLKDWKKKGHPFLDKFTKNGKMNLNELFWKNCKFLQSHENFEIRIADCVNSILNKYFNNKRCVEAYKLIKPCILRDGRIHQIELNDFDLSEWKYDKDKNPWLNKNS